MPSTLVHASCVDLDGKGVLIVGASGSGKSALTLQLMSFGATLVADDRVEVHNDGVHLIAQAPAAIKGLVEARGVGILHASATAKTNIEFVVDLECEEQDRLPECHWYEIDDYKVPCLHRVDAPHFPAAVFQMLKSGRQAPS